MKLSKARAYRGDPSALAVLRQALDVLLRLFAPIVPYVTEEVWNAGRDESRSVHVAKWPQPSELVEGHDDGSFDAAVSVMTQIRRAKSEAKVSMKVPVEQLEVRGPAKRLELLSSVMDDVIATATVRNHHLAPDESAEDLSASVRLGEPEPARSR